MPLSRPARAALGLIVVVCLTVFAPAEPPAAGAPAKPRLLVLVVFDQMRGDYLTRWQPLFGEGGFRRLLTDGAWFTHCNYPYATTTTGPGHASILTGCSAERHGIVNNEWYDRQAAEAVYCAADPRFQRVPPAPPAKSEDKEPKATDKADAPTKKKSRGFGAPTRLLSPTVADVLKIETVGKGRVFGLSLKDRSALLPGGKGPDGAYWFDAAGGQFVTSSYYRDRVHPWVAAFNDERIADRWFGTTWERLRPDLDYAKSSGPDDAPGEGQGVGRKGGVSQGVTFPHLMSVGLTKPGKNYYDALANSPFGNELLLELAKRALAAEKLGRRDAPDLLVVSFSSNDLVGHTWGPDSQEVLDVTLRSDLIVRDLLAALDDQVGKGNYLLALTADHGVCPVPEQSANQGHPGAMRVPAAKLLAAAQKALSDQLDKPGDPKARWIESVQFPWIYLNRRLLAEKGTTPEAAAALVKAALEAQPGVERVYVPTVDFVREPGGDPFIQAVRKSYYPDRSGDLYVLLKPYCLLGTGLPGASLIGFDAFDTGTSHGTPHPYDTHVPLVIYGANVKPGRREEAVVPQATAAIFTAALGRPKPRDAEAPVPDGLWK